MPLHAVQFYTLFYVYFCVFIINIIFIDCLDCTVLYAYGFIFSSGSTEIFTGRPNGILEVDITCIFRPIIQSTIECSVTKRT